MCGICGVAIPDGLADDERDSVRAMADGLIHRGPDSGGFFFDERVGLGSRRLRIVDLEQGDQPIGNEDGTVQVVYNGEIYNHRELRRPLEASGHRFATDTDTEVVVHAYEEHGPDALARLNGIFALALWDQPRRRLLLARDPLGVKPLYYVRRAGGIAFASEVKALLRLPGVSAELDAEAFDLYLSFRFVPPPWTLFRGIRKLAPGERLVMEDGAEPRIEIYAPPPPAPDPGRSAAAWTEPLRDALSSAIRRQLMADVPLGVLLSGGLDSAAVLAVAMQARETEVRAYTVGFEAAPTLDETSAAAGTAARLGAPHRAVRIADDEYRARLVASLFHLDEPVATPSIAPFDALCELASRERKVVLSGQGADEPFGGYPRHRAEALAGGVIGRLLSGPLQLATRLRPGSEPLERAARSFGLQEVARRHTEILALFPAAERRRLRGTDGPDPVEIVARRSRPAEHVDPLGRFLYLDSRFGLADDLLLYADKIAMAHSLEVRVPFLDLELLRLVETIPAATRLGAVRGKSLLRHALEPLVPRSVLARPKRNFAPPDRGWLGAGSTGASVAWLQEPDAAVAAYCDRREVNALLRDQAAGRRDRRRQLFALLAFEIWHRIYLDGRIPALGTAPPVERLASRDGAWL